MLFAFILSITCLVFGAPFDPCDESLQAAQTRRSDTLRDRATDVQGSLWEHSGVIIAGHEGVFPPQLGSGSADLAVEILRISSPQNLRLLDLGTGSGFLGIAAKKAGFGTVLCTDRHRPALTAAGKNASINQVVVEIRYSDLFQNIEPEEQFDVIVFNFFYYPESGTEPFGPARDGGRETLTAFFGSVERHLALGGRILIPFSEFGGERNDPQTIAAEFGYRATVLKQRSDANGWHRVYEIKRK